MKQVYLCIALAALLIGCSSPQQRQQLAIQQLRTEQAEYEANQSAEERMQAEALMKPLVVDQLGDNALAMQDSTRQWDMMERMSDALIRQAMEPYITKTYKRAWGSILLVVVLLVAGILFVLSILPRAIGLVYSFGDTMIRLRELQEYDRKKKELEPLEISDNWDEA